ncbi:MAG: hypothetical protein R3Y58_01995 [Eubacteriales bacterium]
MQTYNGVSKEVMAKVFGQLRPYQLEAIEQMKLRRGWIMADD